MSEEVAIAAADLETVRQLRAALDVALAENDAHHECEKALRADNAALTKALLHWIEADGRMEFADRDADLAELARSLRTTPHPGARLLAELAEAQAEIARLTAWQRPATPEIADWFWL